jgi:hypothetical protein
MKTPTLYRPTTGNRAERCMELKRRGVADLSRRLAIIRAEDALLKRARGRLTRDDLDRLDEKTVRRVRLVPVTKSAH